jgi:hypothetical protein
MNPHAAVITAGSTGLMWFAARINGPPRTCGGTDPDTRNRQNGNTTAGARNTSTRHTHGTRHDPSIKAT